MERGITRYVQRYLMADYWRQAEEAQYEIGACLETFTGGADPRGAYAILKRWNWYASARAPNPSRTDMEKVRGDFQNLYHREETHLPGLTLETHVDPDKVNDEIPPEAEVDAAVLRLCPHRAGSQNHLHTEHLKQWRR